MLTFPIAKSLFPAFSKLSKEKESVKHRAFKFSVKYTSFLVIPSSIALAVLSEEVIYVLYGSQFFLAPNYLTVYILSFLWVGLGLFVVDVFFNGQGDTTATLKMHLVSLGISVPMALLFTYFYGVLGLLVSYFISQFLSTLYGYIYAHKKYRVSIDWTSSFKIGFSAIASALLVYVFNIFIIIPNIYAKLVVSGSLFLFSFLLFAPLFGAINRIDVDNLNELTKEFHLIYPIIRSILALESALIFERK
jgi:O-antigen/teichoic acid export membrane protein